MLLTIHQRVSGCTFRQKLKISVALLIALNLGACLDGSKGVTDDDDSTSESFPTGPPKVFFPSITSTVPESVGTTDIFVELNRVHDKDVLVDYTISGTAVGGGSDYTLNSGTLTIPKGELQRAISPTINDDLAMEVTETLILTLSNPQSAGLGLNVTHTLLITDNEPAPDISFSTATSEATESTTSITISVDLSNTSVLTTQVDYSVTGGTATGSGTDYTLASGTLTYVPSDTSEEISITVANDVILESDETIILTLSNPVNGQLGSISTHTYTIQDDDVPINFDAVTSEGPEGTPFPIISVSLSQVSSLPVTVDYAVASGTATGGGTDYTLSSGTLTFVAGDTQENLPLTIINELTDENEETIVITLSNPVNGVLGTTTDHTYTIQNDDRQISFTSPSSNGLEGNSPADLIVNLSGTTSLTVSVDYSVTGGNATGSGTDYTLAAGTLTYIPTDTSESISIPIQEDALDEENETIIVTISNPSNGQLGAVTSHTFTITDNDPAPTIQFTSSASSATESLVSTLLDVDLNVGSGKTVTVDYAVTSGTATGSGTDYTLSSGTLTYNPGDSSESIVATLVDDNVAEPSGETAVVTISNPSNATLGANTTHTLTIEDDPIALGLAWLQGTQTTTGTNINTTAAPIQWSESSFDSATFDHSTSANSDNLIVKIAGDYLIAVTVPQFSSLQRSATRTQISVNGTPVPAAVGDSSYIRNQNGHQESTNHIALLLTGLSINDVIEVTSEQQALAGTVTIDGKASLYAEWVSPSRVLFSGTATQTTQSTNLNLGTAYALEWTEDRKDSGFTHSDSTNPESIILDQTGDYLALINIPFQGIVTRGAPKLLLQLDGVTVTGGEGKQGYIRNSNGHDSASIHWSGIIPNVSAGSVLTVKTQQEGAAGTVTMMSGKTASISIERLPGATSVFSSQGATLSGGTNWNPASPESILWASDSILDGATYTHTAGQSAITVDVSGDYLLIYQDALTSTAQRPSPRITVAVDGSTIVGAETSCHYIRGSGGHNESSGTLVFLLRDLVAGSIITVQSQAEALAGAVNDTHDAILSLIRK